MLVKKIYFQDKNWNVQGSNIEDIDNLTMWLYLIVDLKIPHFSRI